MNTAKYHQYHVIDTYAIDIPPGCFDTSDDTAMITIPENQGNFNKMTQEEQMQQYDEKCYNYFDNNDDDEEVIEIPHDMFDSDPITETTTYMPTMSEEEPTPPVDNIRIDAADTLIHTDTPNTTIEEAEDLERIVPTSNNYYDNIDHEILQNKYEGTIVFEVDPLAPTNTVTNNNKKKQKKTLPPEQTEELAQVFSPLAELIDENTVEYVFEMLVEDPFDEEDTREFVRGILMEALLSQCDVDGAVCCDSLFVLLDGINTTIDNPIVIPPTNTKIRPTPNTNTNTKTTRTNKKKKKKTKQQATPLTTKSPPKTGTPWRTRNPPKTLAGMMTHVCSKIAEITDKASEVYISRTLLKDPLDDDTRESIRGILKEAVSPKLARVVCDRLFALIDAIEEQ